MTKNEELIENYKKSCNNLANEFCRKHDFYPVKEDNNSEFTSWWAGDKPGTSLFCGDMVFNMDTILTDIEQDAPKDMVIKYFDYSQKYRHTTYNSFLYFKDFICNEE